MEFQKLHSNPSSKPLQTLPLLHTMERKYHNENHPTDSQTYKHKSFYKKQKYMHQNPSSHNSRQPNHHTPSQNTHVPRQINTPYAKPTVTAPKSILVDLSNLGKLDNMLLNLQPGMMICVPQNGVVHNLFLAAKWENMVFYRGQNYFVHLIGEFYANMIVQKGLDDVLKISTVVHNKNMLVDVNTLNRCLKLGEHVPHQPCINIYEKFVFDKKEFELFVGHFCDADVPLGLCEENCAIEYHHFTPLYQQVAIIVRSNLLPKPKNAHYIDFVDLKVMFQLPYGLLLTSLFELYHIAMPTILAEKIEYCDIINLVKPQVPLRNCKPFAVSPVCISPTVMITGNTHASVKNGAEINKLKGEIEILKEMTTSIVARLDQLEGKNKDDSTVGNVEGIDEKMDRLFSEEMVNEMVDKNDKMAIDEAKKSDKEMLPGMIDLTDDMGFVSVDGPEKA
uniref:Uncharacterized protein n=1 Tax=Daucus carota subsp. sativus TaxID=79200 RepID=A0A164TGN3_DAUCS